MVMSTKYESLSDKKRNHSKWAHPELMFEHAKAAEQPEATENRRMKSIEFSVKIRRARLLSIEVGPSGFEPESNGPQPSSIAKLTHGPVNLPSRFSKDAERRHFVN